MKLGYDKWTILAKWPLAITPDCPLALSEVEKDDGFAAVKIGRVTYYSYYFSPNQPIEEFNEQLTRLEGSTSRRGKVVAAGDFNVKSKEWFVSHTERKKVLLSVYHNQQTAMNDGTNPIHFHQGFRSHINVTIASRTLARQIKGCAVLQEESGCDYNYTCFTDEKWTMVSAYKKTGR